MRRGRDVGASRGTGVFRYAYTEIHRIFLQEYHDGAGTVPSVEQARSNSVTGMPKISVEVPEELLADLDDHVGDDGKFVNRSEAIRASIRKTLDLLDDIDERHGRLDDER